MQCSGWFAVAIFLKREMNERFDSLNIWCVGIFIDVSSFIDILKQVLIFFFSKKTRTRNENTKPGMKFNLVSVFIE